MGQTGSPPVIKPGKDQDTHHEYSSNDYRCGIVSNKIANHVHQSEFLLLSGVIGQLIKVLRSSLLNKTPFFLVSSV